MQVPHHGLKNLLGARIGSTFHLVEYRLRDLFQVFDNHRFRPPRRERTGSKGSGGSEGSRGKEKSPTHIRIRKVLSFTSFISFTSSPSFLLRPVYLMGLGATPAGFRTTSSYALSSSRTQNHSAISQPGSSLWSLGGLTQGFVYALGSSMMICNSKVSGFNRR